MTEIHHRLLIIKKAITLYETGLDNGPDDLDLLLMFIEAQIKYIREGK